MQVIYVDVLLVLNFLINYFLLLSCNKVCCRQKRRGRLFVSSLTGAFFSLVIFLPPLGQVPQLLLKLFASAVMVLLLNPWNGWAEFFKEWLAFFVITFFFGGVMLAFRLIASPNMMIYHNGITYFSVSPLLLLINISLAYLILLLIQRLGNSFRFSSGIYSVTLQLYGQSISLRALLDTGNTLTEPFSGWPVVVCSLQQVKHLLPPKIAAAASATSSPALENGLRLVPFSTVGGGGLLPAVKGQLLTVQTPRGTVESECFYVALSPQPIGNQQYQLLLSSGLIQSKKETVHL